MGTEELHTINKLQELQDLQTEKTVLRKKYRSLRDALSMEERLTKSHEIMEAVVGSYDFQRAGCVLLYAACGSEVITSGIAGYAFLLKKKVYCPKVLADGRMEFYRISAYDEENLRPGFYGILEPKERAAPLFVPSADVVSVMLMPGVCFDEKGHRIGYGKGFYDRYLAHSPCDVKMALAYDCQVQRAEELPTDEHDILYDLLVTESGTVCLMD